MKTINDIYCYMITPKDLMPFYKIGEYYDIVQPVYKESIVNEADYYDLEISEIQMTDIGLCDTEDVACLNRSLGHPRENDTESYVVKFSAHVLSRDKASEAIG